MARTYVVSGSASGIGRATRAALEAGGMAVVGVDLRDAEVAVDLATPEGRAALPDAVRAIVAAVDGVIACAGLSRGNPNVTPAQIVAVNHFGMVATVEGLRPLLAGSPAPRAALVASVASIADDVAPQVVDACLAGDEAAALALAAGDGHRAYASSKQAIARWVRREAPTAAWAGAGIPLNAVAPGIVATPMSAFLFATPEQAQATRERVPQPLADVGRAETIASLLVWLTSVENDFMTGQVLFADGGYEAVRRGERTF